jgi:hypothetical protein
MAGWRVRRGGSVGRPEEWDEVKWDNDWAEADELKVVKGEDGVWKMLRRKSWPDIVGCAADGGRRIVFDAAPDARRRGKKGERLVRYQINPLENWGPMRKAKNDGGVKKNGSGGEEKGV